MTLGAVFREKFMSYFIEFVDVHKSFGDRKVLDGISFGVEKGETFAILGPSGVGKTVMLTHIVGLLKPDEGRILVDGQDITEMTEDKLAPIRRKVQLVFQSGALFDSISVWENVAFPLTDVGHPSDEIERKVTDILKLVEIQELADLMPPELSTGMKRAVAIARAVAAEPQAILYDEPTTMVSEHRVLPEAFPKMVCDAFGKSSGVYKNQRRPMSENERSNAIVNFSPHFIAGDRSKFVIRDFNRNIEISPVTGVDDAGIR